MTDTHADAVAALDDAFDIADETDGPVSWAEAMLADPAKRRALLAVLLDTDTVAAALHDTAKHNHNLGEGMARAICWSDSSHSRRAAAIVAALTREPTDAE